MTKANSLQKQFYVEMTDTYCGEANYSWVNRFLVTATTPIGAIRKVTNETGYRAKKDFDDGTYIRYNVPGAAICYFLNEADGTESAYVKVKQI
jgi:hypothetical protein